MHPVPRRPHPWLPLACVVAGCASPVDPPIPFAEPAQIAFAAPAPGPVENPVVFAVTAAEEITSVTYIADGWFTLGASGDVAAGFPFGMDFAVLGAHTMAARGFDADGDFVGEAEVAIEVAPDPSQRNEFGAWLHESALIDPGFSHAEYAPILREVGVKRVYIEGGAGEPDCVAWPDLCDHDVTDLWRGLGVDPWIWFRADGAIEGRAQAETIRSAVIAGYHGIVVDIGTEYADDVDGVEDLLAGMLWVRSQCDTSGLHLGGNFPIYVALNGRPDDQGLPVSAMDPAVDGYVPRTDMQAWTSAQIADPAALATELLCAWRGAGTEKPVHPTVDLVLGDLSPLDAFVAISGRESSLYRVPRPDASEQSWADWAAMDWAGGEFVEPDCGP